jgi:hypothetical protein
MIKKPFKTLQNEYIEVAERTTKALSSRWQGQADIAKALIPTASGAMVLTIALTPALLGFGARPLWRYCLGACWVLLLGTIGSAFSSLRLSMSLGDYALLLMKRTDEFEVAYEAIDQDLPAQSNPLNMIALDAFHSIRRKEKIARRLFDAALICFGLALLSLGAIGVRRLLL